MNQIYLNKSSYRPEIDSLRAFAVLSVVSFHAFPSWLKGGFVGVDIFFVISGFLITSNIIENLNKGKFSFLDFFERRIRRIFPALIVVMICSLLFGWFVLLEDEFSQLGKHIFSSSFFFSNFIFANEIGYFDTLAESKPLLHLWSLSVEEQFYIFWPLSLWIIFKFRLNLLFSILIILSASFFYNLIEIQHHPEEIFFLPFGRIWELLTGGILACVLIFQKKIFRNDIIKNNIKLKKFSYLFIILNNFGITSFLGIIILFGSILIINETYLFPSYIAIFPIFGALLIIIGGNSNNLVNLFISNKILVWFGLISYPLYLWHWPILSYLHILNDGTPDRNARIIALILSVFLASITYNFLEKPIRFGKVKKKIILKALVFLILLIGLTGLIVSIFSFKLSKGVDDIFFRKGMEHRIGVSSRWYQGKGDWLFLGNYYDKTVEKLKLTKYPENEEIYLFKKIFNELSDFSKKNNTKTILLIGPNKSSIYKDKIPTEIPIPTERYINFFLDELYDFSNLTIIDPTESLIKAKEKEGLLYYRTDTHWNYKGAYEAFKILMERMNLQYPKVEFSIADPYIGDLIDISELKNFPIQTGDNWNYKIIEDSQILKKQLQEYSDDTFGWKGKILNKKALNNKSIWVIGDSFIEALRPFINVSFKEVDYIGHWSENLDSLYFDLKNSEIKPDLILILKVERTF